MVGHLTATDLADYMVDRFNVPFREAHFITGRAVALGEQTQTDVSGLSLEQLQTIDKRIEKDVLTFLSIRNSMNARTSYGGTSTQQTLNQIDVFKTWLQK